MAALSSQIIMIVVAVSVITIGYVIFKLKARFAKGRLMQSIVVDDRIVLVTLLHHSSGGGKSSLSSGSYSIRLKFIDIHSGHVIGQNIISRQYEIRMAVNGIIWLTLNRARYQKLADQELIALDVFSNKKVFDQDELKKNLGLAKNETINSMDLDSKQAIFLLYQQQVLNTLLIVQHYKLMKPLKKLVILQKQFQGIKLFGMDTFIFKKFKTPSVTN
ncbi:MAG: hypothetical protein IPJ32_01120 [Sphingobacteriaceae bacterium]|nr:hypothetical protein [Sphingobacteriaceae bacterium]